MGTAMASLTLLILTNWDWDLFKPCWVGLGQGEGGGKHEVSTVASSNWLVKKNLFLPHQKALGEF